jgi:peptidoglycan/LPS O-acetylase OafA/YrhL
MIEKGKRDLTVSASRTIGMIFIVLCHFFGYGPITSLSFLSEVFNVGTSLFIFISGFLYGSKEITEYPRWYFGRFKRICLPMYIYMFFVFIYRLFFVTHKAEPLKYLIYILNIQGLPFVAKKIDYSVFSVEGTDQLWFLTVIMLCYLLVPLLSKIKPWLEKSSVGIKLLCIVLVVGVQTAVSFLGLNLNYFTLFAVGYFLSAIWNREFTVKKYLLLTFVTAIALGTRFLCAVYLQGAEGYTTIIVPLTQDIFAIWIYFTIFTIGEKIPSVFNRIVSSRAMTYFDELSFYIYITHFMFIAGTLKTLDLTANILLNVLITIAAILVSAVILNLICKLILKKRKVKKS